MRPLAVPAGPPEKERVEHLPLHEPYRSWCATCVAGRAVSDRHIWQPPPEGHWQSLDWIMVAWCREVSMKNDAPQSCLGRIVGTSGSMRSPCRVKESLSHGALRLLHRVFPELDLDDSVFGAMPINIGRRGIDGKTPWEQRHGQPCRRSIAEFGEKLLWLPTGEHESHLDERYLPGFWALRCTVMTLWSVEKMDLLVWHGHSVDFQSHSVWMSCYFEECVEHPGVLTHKSVLKSR